MMTDHTQPTPSPETINDGIFVGGLGTNASVDTIDSMAVIGEHGGGALDPPPVPAPDSLPDGVTTHLVRKYRVGRYVYHDLALPLAEQTRQSATGPH